MILACDLLEKHVEHLRFRSGDNESTPLNIALETGYNEALNDVLWAIESVRYRGEVLTGHYAHYCCEWDGLPIDETCIEWPCCSFEPAKISEEQKAEARATNNRVQTEFNEACG